MNTEPDQGIIECRSFSLPFDDVDTDQIFPAEFLTTTERENLGRRCFYSWRHDDQGNPLDQHPLSGFDPRIHQVLVAGENFGCGSSREHAVWALADMGFRAVISSGFADIFLNNALKNGLLPITLDLQAVSRLHERPGLGVRIDLNARTVEIEDYGTLEFPLDPFAAHCMMKGMDQMDFLLNLDDQIRRFENRRS